MFQSLTTKLNEVFARLRKSGKLTDADIDAALQDVKLALLEADVNFKVVRNFISRVKEQAVGAELSKSLTPSQQVVKIVFDELVTLLGRTAVGVEFGSVKPAVFMMAGLQGSGKTTTAAKLAIHLRRQHHKKPLLVAGDIYRPAAIKQLQVLGDQLEVPVFSQPAGTRPAEIASRAIAHAREYDLDVVIIDTAGRLHIDESMMGEVKEIAEVTRPVEVLLVVDSMTGQDAVKVASSFDAALPLTGVVLTKLDGDARGGAALSIREVTGKPIKFVGIGEKLAALEPFHPDRMAQRILGMGDMLTLIEKAEANIDAEKAAEMERKIREADFNFNDFLEQLQQIKNMGPLDQILSMIPGFSGMPKLNEISFEDKNFKRFEAIIYSMTVAERSNPDLIDGNRRRRIAKGSGNTIQDVNRLLKQFNQMRGMMKNIGQMARKGKGFKLPFFG